MKKAGIFALLAGAPAFAAEDMGGFLLHHAADNRHEWPLLGKLLSIPIDQHWIVYQNGKITVDLFPSLHGIMLILGAIVTLLILVAGARRRQYEAANRWSLAIEQVVVFLRDEVVIPNVGKKEAARWFPLIATLFFFILVLNFIGLIPVMASATGNLAVTATLAGLVFVIFNVSGMLRNGVFGYIKGLVPSGLPFVLTLVFFPLEILNVLSKTVALALRLFANMLAGHMLISAIIGLIVLFQSYIMSPLAMGLTLAIYVLKIFIALLQAFVFAMLTSLFIGSAVHQEH